MLLNNIAPLSFYKIKRKSPSANAFPGRSLICSPTCSLHVKTPLSTPSFQNYQNVEDSIERIREAFGKAKESSASSYDTAWVAMVPSLETPNKPYFPQCLDWIIKHQHKDGSWGPNPTHPFLVKDNLSCTLACLLALRKWGFGEKLVQRGLDFIQSNIWAVNEKSQISPIGFEITFPSMINYAKNFELVLPLDPSNLYFNKDFEIHSRCQNLAYISEGLGESYCNWDEILVQQRSNGSLFNSPATTAAAFIHSHNQKCLDYLHSVLKIHESWVPTIYPSTMYTRLSLIDTLERLGVGRYFQQEIERVLDETYRFWQLKDEDIFADVNCLALAFRLLRIKGYPVTSDDFEPYSNQEKFFNTVSIQFTGVTTVLELFRASQFKLFKDEAILDQIQAWTSIFLKQQLLNNKILDKNLHEQVKFTLKNFHGTLDRLGYRRNIDLYDVNEIQILKTSYRCSSIDNKDILVLAQHDFNIQHNVHQKELQILQRWYTDNRLDRLKFGRRVLQTAYFLIASLISKPELSEARIAYAQCVVLVTLIDDFFDDYGSKDELRNIVEVVKKWEPRESYSCVEMEILMPALLNTVNEMAKKGAIKQGRPIKTTLLKQWVDLIEGFMKEWEWWNEKITPTMDEYLSFTHTTIGCKVSILTAIHFLGPKFHEDMITSEECTSLCWNVSLICRLLNDIQTYKKESAENSPNMVAMQVAQNEGSTSITKDEIISKIQDMVDESRRKLLHIVFQIQGSIVPKECKHLFWGTGKIGYYLYCQGGDEFSSPDQMIKDIEAVIYEPLNLPNSSTA